MLKPCKIDFLGKNGFSICIVTNEKLLEDEIVDYALEHNAIDKYDVEDFYVQAEEITNDKYEMKFWKEQAIKL